MNCGVPLWFQDSQREALPLFARAWRPHRPATAETPERTSCPLGACHIPTAHTLAGRVAAGAGEARDQAGDQRTRARCGNIARPLGGPRKRGLVFGRTGRRAAAFG
jgi:hypothetical protein